MLQSKGLKSDFMKIIFPVFILFIFNSLDSFFSAPIFAQPANSFDSLDFQAFSESQESAESKAKSAESESSEIETADFSTLENVAESMKSVDKSSHSGFVDFFNAYNASLYSSQGKLTLMHKKNILAKLGKESKDGKLSGNVSYATSISGFNGIVTIEYKDYSDFSGWILNGFTNVKANLFGNGIMFGTVEVVYGENQKAWIVYDNLEIKKQVAGGGFYIVRFESGEEGRVAWNEIKLYDFQFQDNLADSETLSKNQCK